jgi:hypothetical protein
MRHGTGAKLELIGSAVVLPPMHSRGGQPMSQVVISLAERRAAERLPTPLAIDPNVPLLKLIRALAEGGFDVAFDARRNQLMVRETPID